MKYYFIVGCAVFILGVYGIMTELQSEAEEVAKAIYSSNCHFYRDEYEPMD